LDLALNSKTLLILLLIFTFGCGVKGDPIVPQDTLLPSVEGKYMNTDKDKTKKEEEPKEEEKAQKDE
jgi:hypothetical protein